ncbi:sodium-dependent transporter [Carboxydothermus hydrogenoformans]|uniref:Transporter n=1 Tax=Carboxydothermus hydrogenoformans (strain ATCC BAA-161 / DSM 6008 / Z-2901) TaxID=246194 RepID=Q3AFZ4_CARHZ|nr:sodium-dependent transporter [Carboxydothermus hydrogenoformans]ABB15626.1 sodium transporter family protein [Carboxydothermus hydrogenoformans Z-2901]
MEGKKRETFSSSLAVFFATLGSAIGLGNIWRFPYITGMNGGGGFLLIYFLCILFVGIPIMISEFYIGRKTRSNAVGAFRKLNHSNFKFIGLMGVLAAFLIMFFYSSVAGWVYSYVFKSIIGEFNNITVEKSKELFNLTISHPFYPILWQFVVLLVVAIILIFGVKKGIERVTKTLMPVLFLLILIIDIRALTLDGAREGVNFLINVDFSKITRDSILIALGLAFFKLSIGMGTMITYGSYFTRENNMPATAAKVAFSDTLVSLLAGLAIFPVVFTFNMEPAAGPGLLFITIPLVFTKLPLGTVLLTLFFILTSIAATTAMISMVEVPVAYFAEEKGMERKKAVLLTTAIIFVFGVFATLSLGGSPVISNFKLFGKNIFDLFDYVSSNILLPLGGLFIAIFVGYFVKKEDLYQELGNFGLINNQRIIDVFYLIVRYVTPILVIVIFLNSLGLLG